MQKISVLTTESNHVVFKNHNLNKLSKVHAYLNILIVGDSAVVTERITHLRVQIPLLYEIQKQSSHLIHSTNNIF